MDATTPRVLGYPVLVRDHVAIRDLALVGASGFGYGQSATRLAWRGGVPVATSRNDAVAVRVFNAGRPQARGGMIDGCFKTQGGGPDWGRPGLSPGQAVWPPAASPSHLLMTNIGAATPVGHMATVNHAKR